MNEKERKPFICCSAFLSLQRPIEARGPTSLSPMLPSATFSTLGPGPDPSPPTVTSRGVGSTEPIMPKPTLTFVSQDDIETILQTYVEPEAVTKRLFSRFDVSRRGFFTIYDVRRVALSLGLRPKDSELRALVHEVQPDGTGKVSYGSFRKMRLAHQGEMLYKAGLNVMAEFSKFNVDELHRGRITSSSVERALGHEGVGPSDRLCRAYTASLLQCDSDGDGQVSFRDLYDAMTGRIPQPWLDWIYQELKGGSSSEAVIETLIQSGFEERVAREIVALTISSPVPLNSRCFADTDVRSSYRIMV